MLPDTFRSIFEGEKERKYQYDGSSSEKSDEFKTKDKKDERLDTEEFK